MKFLFFFSSLLIAINIEAQINQKSSQIQSHYALGNAYLESNDFEEAVYHFNLGLEQSEIQKDPDSMALGHYYISGSYFKEKKYVKAGASAQKALSLFEAINDRKNIAESLVRLGDIKYKQSNFDQANFYFLEALKINEQLGNEIDIASVLSKIGRIYLIAPDPEINLLTAMQFYDRALKIYEKFDDDRWIMKIKTSIGSIYLKQGINQSKPDKITKAIEIFEQALVKAELLRLQNDEAVLLGNIGSSLRMLDRYGESLDYLFRALQIKLKDNNLTSAAHTCNDITETYMALNDLDNAKKFALRAVELASGLSLNQERFAYYLLSQIHLRKRNFKNAYYDLKQYHKLADSIFSIQKIATINENQIKYETEKKSLIIKNQESDIALLNEKNKLKNRNIFIGLLGLLLLFGSILFYRSRSIDKEKQAMQKQFSQELLKSQEAERTRIARDLHDGIGQSLLLIKKQMEKSDAVVNQNRIMIAETLEEVRALSRNLHPFQLDKFGLTATVKNVILKVSNSTELFLSEELINIDNLIPKTSYIHIYRTIQEALNNIIKHSEATAAKIVFAKKPSEILITIQDNGIGFDPEHKNMKSKSLGLKTMEERISSIGGKLIIQKGKPNGTFISIHIPRSK